MKKVFKVLTAVGVFFALGLVGCSNPSTSSSSASTSTAPSTSISTSTKTQDELDLELLESIEYVNKEVSYNGKEQSLVIGELPEGVTAKYKNNVGTDAGKYKASVELTLGTQSVTKEATLIINKAKATITAETNQTIVNYGSVLPKATIDSDSEITYTWYKNGVKLTNQNVRTAGEYTVKLSAKATKNYQIPKTVEVNVKLVDSLYNLDFVSETFVYDGTQKEIKLSGDVPSNVTVEYDDNVGTDVGTYYATAKVKDSTGKVVETHGAVLNIVNPHNEDFDAYCDEFFIWYLEGDQYACNLFMENPKDFGLEHYDAEWYTYNEIENIEEALAHDKALYQEELNKLETFKDARLSPEQLITYEQIEGLLKYQVEWCSINDVIYMENLYIDQFGGYVSDFNSCMEDYLVRKEQDVIDIIDFIESTDTAFASYLVYLDEKTEAGYGLSDVTLNGMIDYIDDLLDEEEYYLIEILRQKINGLTFLDDNQKASYIAEMEQACNGTLVVAAKDLRDGLEKYVGKLPEEKEGYWTKYENGATLYKLELGDLLGYEDLDIEAYLKELDAAFLDTYGTSNASSSLASRKIGDVEKYLEKNPIFEGTPDEMVEFLREFAKTIVPELENDPTVYVKEMDEATAKVSTAVAYYRKSALDNTGAEYITLNPLKLGDAPTYEVLGTMAHEGYPGHLYAYCYSKELDLHPFSVVNTSTAHAEGWATYVEFQLYEYAKTIHKQENYNVAMDYLIGNHLTSFMLEARIDLGIFYEGWKAEDINACLQRVLPGYSFNDVDSLYNQFLEMPTTYHAYGYGKYIFYSYHQEAKQYLGDSYDEKEFNAMLLSKGWTNLAILEETYTEYMKAKCHELGIEFQG